MPHLRKSTTKGRNYVGIRNLRIKALARLVQHIQDCFQLLLPHCTNVCTSICIPLGDFFIWSINITVIMCAFTSSFRENKTTIYLTKWGFFAFLFILISSSNNYNQNECKQCRRGNDDTFLNFILFFFVDLLCVRYA